MSSGVDVIVGAGDDLATTQAVHQLAAREPGVLAVSIVAGVCSSREVMWAILRALGKRVERLSDGTDGILDLSGGV